MLVGRCSGRLHHWLNRGRSPSPSRSAKRTGFFIPSMLTNCFNCDQPISEKARFCAKCTTQVRCKNCGEDLVSGGIACEMCGVEVTQREATATASTVPMNSFKYRDGKKDIDIDANFTNEVGAGAAQIFAMLRGGQAIPPMRMPIKASKAIGGQTEDLFSSAEVVNEDVPEAAPLAVLNTSLLSSLFERRDEQWVLINPELKAKSKADFVRRATCFFLQFQFEKGITQVPRTEVVNLLKNCSVYDPNARDWFTKEKSLFRATLNDFSLLLPGHKYVKEVSPEVADDSIENTWEVGTKRKTSKKTSSKKDPATSESKADINPVKQ